MTPAREAALAEDADPGLPYAAFIEGRLLHDRDEREAALDGARSRGRARWATGPRPSTGLHRYRGDTLARLDRHAEAQDRVRTGDPRRAVRPARLHQPGHAPAGDAAAATTRWTVEQLVRRVPTPAGYAAAVRLSALLGKRERAAQLRAEARQRLAGEPALRLVPR